MTIDNAEQEFVSVSGGYLVQDKDNKDVTRNDMTVATDIQPTEAQWEAMLLGWKVVSAVKSNAVILSNNKQTVGIGAGQMNRVGSAKIAIERAIEINDNVALVSDGFFPWEIQLNMLPNMVLRQLFNQVVQLKIKIPLIWLINMALQWL